MNPNIEWSQFKNICAKRSLDMIMLEYSDYYALSASEASTTIKCRIFKDGDSDCIEFETNYKDRCNPQVGNRSEMIPLGRFSFTLDSNDYPSDPYIFQMVFPNDYPMYQLWGMSGHVLNFGSNDYIKFNIRDVDNILGAGANYLVKSYDEMWCVSVAKSTAPFLSPDGYPGVIPAGLYAEIEYHATDISKNNVIFYGDLLVTVGS